MITGLAALVSALAGIFGGSVPKIFDLFEKKMSFAQEMKIREFEHKNRMVEGELQIALAEKGLAAKVEEQYYEAVRGEMDAQKDIIMQGMAEMAKPTGFVFLDVLNAAIRPVFFVATLSLFLVAVAAYVFADPAAFSAQMVTTFGVAVEGVLGWVCGYRAAVKPPIREK